MKNPTKSLRRTRLIHALGALSLCLAIPAGGAPAPRESAIALPRLGDNGGLDMVAERKLGDRIAQQILRDPDHFEDPALTDYLRHVWQPLLHTAQTQGQLDADMADRFAWKLMLIKDRSVNAFALPGGYLGVNLGLMATVGSTDELASVLAHELSHVAQRHISRMVAQQDRQTPWIIGAMVLGAIAASKAKNVDVAQAAMVGGQAAAMQTQLNFSRDMEREADRVGFGVMTEAGFDGLGFVSMFGKLQQAARLSDDGSFPYLRSHPLSTERIADMATRQAQLSAQRSARPPVATTQTSRTWHAQMAARARILTEPDTHRLHAWADGQPVSGTDVAPGVLAYSSALAASRLKNHAAAVKRVNTAPQSADADPQARLAWVCLALEVGQAAGWPKEAHWTSWADEAAQSGERSGVLWGNVARLELGQAAQASDALQSWVVDHPDDAQAWQVLSRTWNAQGQPIRAIRAEAEARLAALDLAGAVDRLQAGRDLMRQPGSAARADHTDLSILDARWRELSQRLREEQKDERR
ncbi:M48 family metalloprotease [Hydrogenophaga soli]